MDKKVDLKIECIKWADAESIDQWESVKDINPDMFPIIYSVGIVLRESEMCVVVALNFDSSNEKASCIMLIPKAMILDRWSIGNGEPNKSSSNPTRRKR